LADLGARVIKIDATDRRLDEGRRSTAQAMADARTYAGKECMQVDLQTSEGKEILHRLIARAARRVTLITTVTPAASLDMLFVATREGIMHIYHEDSPDKLSEVEAVKTEFGAKTLQVDPKTHNVFLSTSDFNPPAAPTEKQPHPQPTPKAGNFRVLVFGK
jgi:hypothetical protein